MGIFPLLLQVSGAFRPPPDVSCAQASPFWQELKSVSWQVARLSPSHVNETLCSNMLDQFSVLPVNQEECPLGGLTLQVMRVLYGTPSEPETTNDNFEILVSSFKFFILTNNLYPDIANSGWPLVFASDWPLFELLARLQRGMGGSGPSRCGADSSVDRATWAELLAAMEAALNEEHGIPEPEETVIRLSERGRAKWSAIYVGNFTISARLADEAFSAFNAEWWKQDCICGFMAIYLYRSVPFLVREKEGWAGRFFSGMNALMSEAGLLTVLRSEWPVFEILLLIKRLTRGDDLARFHGAVFGEPPQVRDGVARTIRSAVGKFVSQLQQAVADTAALFASSSVSQLSELSPLQRLVFLSDKYDTNVKLVYVVAVYGPYSAHLQTWLDQAAGQLPLIVVIALDGAAENSCVSSATVACLKFYSVLPESVISKYVVAEYLVQAGFDVVLLDFDTWIFADPTQRFFETSETEADVVLPTFYLTDNLNPFAVLYRRSGASVLSQLKHWLYVNPFGEEHLAFDAVLGHRAWDVYIKNYQDKSNLSWFFRSSGNSTVRFAVLDSRRQFVSADGWLDALNEDGNMKIFHFWGADQPVHVLFSCLRVSGRQCAEQYKKKPQFFAGNDGFLPVAENFNLLAISYASGCCGKAQSLNAETAVAHGANSTRKYTEKDVDEQFKNSHAAIWNQKRGGGYWIWKPYLILKTLLSEELQWGDVVVYLDAGNHYIDGDLRGKVRELLAESDVSGGYLKCCIESDWTKRDALVLLNGDKSSILDRPQMAAYFLLFRKTPVAIQFVHEWLKACTDPRIVTDLPNTLGLPNHPTFTNHIHDQAALSILFKHFGFKGFDLDRAHELMKLARWRE